MSSRSIACSWVLTSQGVLSPRGIVVFDQSGVVLSIEENCSQIDNRAMTQYFNGMLCPELVELCGGEISPSRAKASLSAGVRLVALSERLKVECAQKKYVIFSPLDDDSKNYSYISQALASNRLLISTSKPGELLPALTRAAELLEVELTPLLVAASQSVKTALGLDGGAFRVGQESGCTLIERDAQGALSSRGLVFL